MQSAKKAPAKSKEKKPQAAKKKTAQKKTAKASTKPKPVDRPVARIRAWLKANARGPKVIVPATLVVVYLLGSVLFSTRYLPGTTLGGEPASLRTPADMASRAKERSADLVTSVTGDGIYLKVAGSDVGLSLDADAYAQGAAAHLPGWAWPFLLFSSRDYDAAEGTTLDTSRLEALLAPAVEAANATATPSLDARISYDDGQGTFVAIPEEQGSTVSLVRTLGTVEDGMRALHANVDLGPAELEHPELLSDPSRTQAAIDRANELDDLAIDLTVRGRTVYTIEPDLLRSWLVLDQDYGVAADLDAVTEWARGDLSAVVDTVGTARTYTRTSDGKRIDVYGGTYGWNADGAALAELVCAQVAAGAEDPIEIPMQSESAVYVHGGQDWGPRYVDVDLSEQYVVMFDDDSNVLVESACVTGDITKDNETVTGVYAIQGKESPAKLIGLDYDEDGEPDYESDVEYWMPFFGGYGLHDALWRDYFGSDVYQYGGGSHGCVNLPYDAAELLFAYVRIGDVVVVHY